MSELRAITPTDAAVLAALHQECFPDDPWGPAAVSEVLAMPGAFGFLAIDAAGPSGFLIALAVAGECEILALGVRTRARRRGVAAALLERLLGAIAGTCPVVLLEVAEDNASALALYRRAGFFLVGRRPAYYRRTGGAMVAALKLRRSVAHAAVS